MFRSTSSLAFQVCSITANQARSVGSGGHESSKASLVPGARPSERAGSSTYSWTSARPASKSKWLYVAAAASLYQTESGLKYWVPPSEMPVPPRASMRFSWLIIRIRPLRTRTSSNGGTTALK